MAKVKITGHASGSGVFTITAPNSNTDRTITLPDASVTLGTDATKLPLAGGAMSGTITNFTSTGIDDNANATAITINATENVGIEVTPESWEDNYPALQIGGQGSLGGHSSSEVYLNDNVYRNGGNWKHINTAAASQYQGTAGKHKFKIAPSASADANITWTTAMTIDNSGAVTKPLQPAFSAQVSSTYSILVSQHQNLPFATEIFDQNADFNTSTYTFTAPVTGKYQLNLVSRVDNMASNATYYHLYLFTSNRTYFDIIDPRGFDQDPAYLGLTVAALADMDAGDTATAKFYQSGGTSQSTIASSGDSSFSGFLAC